MRPRRRLRLLGFVGLVALFFASSTFAKPKRAPKKAPKAATETSASKEPEKGTELEGEGPEPAVKAAGTSVTKETEKAKGPR